MKKHEAQNQFGRTSKSVVYLRDCLEAMREMDDNAFDLAIVDPPYGIGIETSGTYFKKFESKGWDNAIPSKEYFRELNRVSVNQIIWGGNYFLEFLGSTKCLLIWDKMISEGMSFADGEIAWASFKKPMRIKKILSRADNGGKIHPTQKPVALYKWLLTNYAKEGDTILDTHLGSQSSRIACYDLGFDFTGFELDEDYFKQGNERFEKHIAQGVLF